MTNLPEIILAYEGDDRVEYVRADIVTARIAAESEPQWQDGYNSARDDLDAESAHISAREAKLAEIDAHRRKVIAENERQMNALIESSRRIAALEAQLDERQAENDRLKEDRDEAKAGWSGCASVLMDTRGELAKALSRTGAVNVDRHRLNIEISKWATDSDLHITIGDVEALHLAILSAIEATPPAPKVTEEMVEALEGSITALDDWLHIYAPDECSPNRVAEAKRRISAGGTLWYIAVTQERNRAALTAAQEAGKP